MNQPLWPQQPPEWFDNNWRQLQGILQSEEAIDENWQIWTNWFNARITGAPANQKLELARATIEDEIWDQGPKVVNAHIQQLIDGSQGKGLRAAIADAASPAPFVNEDKKLDAGPNKYYDQTKEYSKLVGLLDTQLTILETLLAILPDGTPKTVRKPIEMYQRELLSKGVQPSVETLDAMIAMVARSVNGPNVMKNWSNDAWEEGFTQLCNHHRTITDKFPFKPMHDEVYHQAIVDEKAASREALTEPINQLLGAVKLAHDAGLTTDEFLRVVEQRQQIVALLGTVPEGAEQQELSSKKRAILQDAGFVDKAIERIEKVAKISSTDAGKALLKTMGEVGKALWKFIPM